jgi:hypothetical protein
MSKLAGDPPQSAGAPGHASWLMATPLSVSAVCSTSAPTTVTGETKPVRGIETYSTGMPARAQSTTFCDVTSLHLRGAVGQQEKIVRGFARSASAEPRTATWRSRITANASTVKAPVTTGFAPRRSARKRR